MKTNKIIFDVEGSEKDCAFFALYAGLRMYKEHKDKQVALQNKVAKIGEECFSIAAAEAFSLLEQLKENHPKEFKEAELEFNECYNSVAEKNN
jgi:hypothetical protein